MKIIIVGAGIGGLSTALALAKAGHDVTIYESSVALAEIGAGVQITPNATKWFWKWGLGPDLLAHSALPDAFIIRRDHDGSVVRSVTLDSFTETYGAPYVVTHRADIHRILHEHAVEAGVTIHLNSHVESYDFENGSITFEDSRTETADLVVAMDGVNSPARQEFLPETGRGLQKTGWAAYRVMASVEKLKRDPRTAQLVSKPSCNCWFGEQKVVMTHMVKGSQWLNMVFSHCDDIETTNWTSGQYKAELKLQYEGWDPSVVALLEHANTNIQNWPIEQVMNLPRWTSESGRFALAGDAAHGMAFYLYMGVSTAVEDAAALCECLDLHQKHGMDLCQAMKIFEQVRKPRGEAVRDASLHAGNILQMELGPVRNRRDKALIDDGKSADRGPSDSRFYATRNSYGIADKDIRDWCYGYDAVEAVKTAHAGKG